MNKTFNQFSEPEELEIDLDRMREEVDQIKAESELCRSDLVRQICSRCDLLNLPRMKDLGGKSAADLLALKNDLNRQLPPRFNLNLDFNHKIATGGNGFRAFLCGCQVE
jgi:hypothetical protein